MQLGFLPGKLGRGAVALKRTLLTSKHPFLPGKRRVDLVSRKALAAGTCLKNTTKTPAASASRLKL